MMTPSSISMYCEKEVFYGGNYVFFPGVSTHCLELFRAMTESIRTKGGPVDALNEFAESEEIELVAKLYEYNLSRET